MCGRIWRDWKKICNSYLLHLYVDFLWICPFNLIQTHTDMKSLFYYLFITFLFFSCQPNPTSPHTPDQEEWVSLFNGVDLDDWNIKIRGYELNENYANTFRVEDGLLQVRYDEGYESFDEQFGHIFYQEPFSHYRLRAEYRFVGEQANDGPGWALRNSGLMVHGQSAESMAVDQDFPISIEVQLLGGTGEGSRTTANLCTPGTHVVMADTLLTTHCISSQSQTYHGEQWVEVEVLVLGDSLIRHLVNGDPVLEYTKPQVGGGVVNQFHPSTKKDGMFLNQGTISLQSESHPIDFRKVELLNLKGCKDPKASNYKSYFVEDDRTQCNYD